MPKENSLIYYSDIDNNITLPNTTTTPKNNPFTNDTYYYVSSNENKLTSINSGYFNDDRNITDIIIGEKITSINSYAFSECTNLKYIYLSDDIQWLKNECFFGCESLTSIYIPIKCSFGNCLFSVISLNSLIILFLTASLPYNVSNHSCTGSLSNPYPRSSIFTLSKTQLIIS